MPITPEVLDQILKDYEKPEDLLSDNGLLQQLTKALLERALNGELTHHLGYEKHDPAGNNSGNSRNGTTPKVVKGKRGRIFAHSFKFSCLRRLGRHAQDFHLWIHRSSVLDGKNKLL